MKKYWLLLESYVFLWSNEKEILIYNHLSGQGYLYRNSAELNPIVEQLKDKSNLYCTTICEEDLKKKTIGDFIADLRKNFCGDIFDTEFFPKKPVVIIPELTVNEETYLKTETVKRDVNRGVNAMSNLLECTIHLTENCSLKCPDCNSVNKQLTWCCSEGNKVMTMQQVASILEQLQTASVHLVNFIGGDVFSYPHFDELMSELEKYHFNKKFYIDHRLISKHINKINQISKLGLNLVVLVNAIDTQIDDSILSELENLSGVSVVFLISKPEEYQVAEEITTKHNLNSKIIPFFNSTNIDFFEEYVFQDLTDILDTKWGRSELFSNMVINSNNFGKLTILPSGDSYANFNHSNIGNIFTQTIDDMVNNEMSSGKVWRNTRDSVKPCKDCICKYLCPPISNYEYVTQRYNFCKLPKQ
ncbi:hypothetical protein BN938_0311 [Mucinivorans hirudinis]|uniref:Uncharacterized protein n=1 Tax=Mucinivorans hirudinis TaxID=1433126 RepID=A0A060R693_9BACT|nr:hypothetical protein BN938_0311 [Mucinivorans hirudinis]